MYVGTYLVGLIYHGMSPVLACKGTDLVLSPGVQSPIGQDVTSSMSFCQKSPCAQPHCAAQQGRHRPWGICSQCWEGDQPCTVSLCDMSQAFCGHKVSWSQGELLSSWKKADHLSSQLEKLSSSMLGCFHGLSSGLPPKTPPPFPRRLKHSLVI